MNLREKCWRNGKLSAFRKRKKDLKNGVHVEKRRKVNNEDVVTDGIKSLPCMTRTTSLPSKSTDKEGQLMLLESLKGFLIYLDKKCCIKFVSSTIKDHLGIAQAQLIGQSALNIIHIGDQWELVKQFTKHRQVNTHDRCEPVLYEDETQRVFYVRMNYSLPVLGSKTKHSGYMLVRWTGKMKKHVSSKTRSVIMDGLLCICQPMQTSLLEIRMDGNVFMSCHDLGMTFTFCDARITTLIGYEPDDVIGKIAYYFHNPIDATIVQGYHQNLLTRGASVSKYYRFMGKNNIWVWLQTRASIICNTSNKAMYIVCMNYVISEEEGEKYLMLEEQQQASSHRENTILTLPNNVHHLQSVCTPGSHIVELDEENHKNAACLNDELNRPPIPISVNGQFGQYFGADNNIEPRIMVQASPSANGYKQTDLMDQSHNCCHQITPCSLQSIPRISENSTFIEPHLSVSSPDDCTFTYTDSLDTRSAEIFIVSPMDQLKDGNAHAVTTSCSSPSVIEDAGYDSATSPYLSSMYFSPPIVSPACSNDSASTERGYFSDTNSGSRGLIQGQNINFGLGYSSSASCVTSTDLLQVDDSMDDDGTTDLSSAEIILDQLLQSFNQQQNPQDSSARNMAAVFSTVEILTSQTPPVLCSNAKSTHAESTFTNVLQTLPAVCKHHVNTISNQNVKKFDKPLLRSFLTMPEDDIPKHPVRFLQSCSNNPSKVDTKDLKSLTKDSNAKHIGANAQKCLIQQHSTINQKGFANRTLDIASAQKPATYPSLNIDDSLDFSAMPDDITEFALQYLDNVADAQTKATMTEFQSDNFMDTSESDLTKDLLGTLKTRNSTSPCFNRVRPSDSNLVSRAIKTLSSHDHGCFSTVSKYGKSHSQTLDVKSHNNVSLFPINCKCGCQGISSHDHLYHQSLGRFNGQTKLRSHKVSEYMPTNPVKLNGVASSAFCSSDMHIPERSLSILETHLRKGIQLTNKLTQEVCKSNKPFLQQLLTGELTNDMYIQMERERFHKDMGISPR